MFCSEAAVAQPHELDERVLRSRGALKQALAEHGKTGECNAHIGYVAREFYFLPLGNQPIVSQARILLTLGQLIPNASRRYSQIL